MDPSLFEQLQTQFVQIQTQIVQAKEQVESWEAKEATAKKNHEAMMNLAKHNVEALNSKMIFDVGGTLFSTTKETLMRVKDSYFTSMMESGCWAPQKDGTYFIDRSPKYFGLILDYLRYDALDTTGLSEIQAKMLQLDFDYFFPSRKTVPAKPKTQSFNYVSDFDTNGLLYGIGTGFDPEGTYVNPCTSGGVKVEISHEKLYLTDMQKHNIISRSNSPVSTYWGGTAPQWFSVDLGDNNRLMCSHYTLRHGYSAANSYGKVGIPICNWEFQASVDGDNWIMLHKGDETPFNKGYDTKTFPIKECHDYFRYYRVLQKGNNSVGVGVDGGSPYLAIGGFELYGQRLLQ